MILQNPVWEVRTSYALWNAISVDKPYTHENPKRKKKQTSSCQVDYKNGVTTSLWNLWLWTNFTPKLVVICLLKISLLSLLPLEKTFVSWRSGHVRYKTAATENRPHEGIIKFSPIMVDSVRRGTQEHP